MKEMCKWKQASVGCDDRSLNHITDDGSHAQMTQIPLTNFSVPTREQITTSYSPRTPRERIKSILHSIVEEDTWNVSPTSTLFSVSSQRVIWSSFALISFLLFNLPPSRPALSGLVDFHTSLFGSFLIPILLVLHLLQLELYSEEMRWRTNALTFLFYSQSFNSLAIFEAIFLKPIDVPDILLKRTPFNESRGNLHTSISHWTSESAFGSPWTHNSRNRSRCS